MKDCAAIFAEQRLVAAARSGDPEAFSELVTTHREQIYRVSLRLLKNREDAEDNVQITMLRAYRYICRFNSDSKFSTWLVRIAINQALMFLRSKTAHAQRFTPGCSEDGVDLAMDVPDPKRNPEIQYQNRELVEKALNDLSPALRSVFLLSKLEGWTNIELGERFGLSKEQLKQRVFRARHIMRKSLYHFSAHVQPAECAEPAP